jgi:hypothetical protein
VNQVIAERYHWPVWLFWLLSIVMLGVSVLNTALRMSREERVTGSGLRRADEGLA